MSAEATDLVVGIAAVATGVLLSLSMADPPDANSGTGTRAVRIAKGLVFGGGATMVVGAGVMLPIAMHTLLETPARTPSISRALV